ncbi:hypothetical protein MKW92_031182 [Papaver armeniacum]|nr:hypothetical protein MKW92_031182 [Papaver armeniacum]
MISGYAHNGRCELALTLFGGLKLGRRIHSYIAKGSDGTNLQQSVSLTNAVIHMYASCGAIEEAYRAFRGMPLKSLISWNTMIVGFAKQGCRVEALRVFRWMLTAGVRPDEVTFLGVLCACSHTGMVKEGRHYFDYMLLSCEIESNIKHYGCMVDLLSQAGLLDEAQQLIHTIPMKPNDVIWGALLSGDHIVELEPDRAAGHLVLLANLYGDLTHENAPAIYNMASQIAHQSV